MGKLPPPYIGPAVAAQIILNSRLKEEFQLIHLDLSDHRDVNTLSKIDFVNIYLAFKQYTQLVVLILKHKPDMVYIPAGQTTIGYLRDAVFILLSKLFRRRVLCHLRGGNFLSWYNASSRVTQWVVRIVHRRVDGQIVLGSNLRQLFSWILPEDKIFVVPNGGNYTIANEARQENTNPDTDRCNVLFLGNFIGSKGVLDVLKASRIVNETYPKARFRFAGSWRDSETRTEFNRFMSENPHLAVDVLGPVTGDDKYKLLASSDLFVFPTYYPNEGHPWVIVEAMAAGLPIISTRHAAIPESVHDGVNGYLVEKHSPKQIAEKVIFLIKNPDVRQKMSGESRRIYLENFTEDIMVRKLGASFSAVLNPKQFKKTPQFSNGTVNT